MKHFYLVIALVLVCLSAPVYSTVYIVDNTNNNPGAYTNILTAVGAASPGDTVYVQGSGTGYLGGVINKRITLIGTGHKPDKHAPLASNILGGPGFDFMSGARGSRIMGFILTGGLNINCDSIYIADNYIAMLGANSAYNIIEGNIILGGINFNGLASYNNIVRNNIISNPITNSQDPATEITNNVIIGNSSSPLFTGFSNGIFKNNIVYGVEPIGATGATFLNNITYQVTQTIPYGSNTGSGNQNNVDPLFVNAPPPTISFSYTYDFNLQVASTGVAAGTDGLDIGLYGGLGSFKPGGEPPIPLIKEFNIYNSIVPVGTSIDINIKGEVQN